MFIHVILDVQSHLDSTQESRISPKTPWRMVWRLIGECPLPIHLKAWNLAQSFPNVYICNSWNPKSSRLQSGTKKVLQVSKENLLFQITKVPPGILHRSSLRFIYVYYGLHVFVCEPRWIPLNPAKSHWIPLSPVEPRLTQFRPISPCLTPFILVLPRLTLFNPN